MTIKEMGVRENIYQYFAYKFIYDNYTDKYQDLPDISKYYILENKKEVFDKIKESYNQISCSCKSYYGSYAKEITHNLDISSVTILLENDTSITLDL